MSLSETDSDLVARLRRLNSLQRRRLLEEAEAQDRADTATRANRLLHLQRAISLWPRSAAETQQLLDDIYAAREIEE